MGDGEFAATFAGMTVRRYVDCCDVVTRVPPPALGYAHIAPRLHIDRNGLITLDPDATVTAKDRFSAEADYLLRYAWKVGNVGVRDLADHAPFNYVRAVTAANRA